MPNPRARQLDSAIQASESLERAIALAVDAHRGQRYPSPEREPYVLHLFRVMLAVDDVEAQTVAVLHDVLEDTRVAVGDLRDAGLPELVVAAVLALTAGPDQPYEAYIEQVAADPIARRVKLADLEDNLANNRRFKTTAEIATRIWHYEHAVERLSAIGGTTVGGVIAPLPSGQIGTRQTGASRSGRTRRLQERDVLDCRSAADALE